MEFAGLRGEFLYGCCHAPALANAPNARRIMSAARSGRRLNRPIPERWGSLHSC